MTLESEQTWIKVRGGWAKTWRVTEPLGMDATPAAERVPVVDEGDLLPLRPFDRQAYQHPRYWDAVQRSANRMAMSEPKYGPIEDTRDVDRVAFTIKRLELYLETGNVEWLYDAANGLLIEAVYPAHPEAHFRATGSEESPGIGPRQPD